MGNLPSHSSNPNQQASNKKKMSENMKDVSMVDVNEALNKQEKVERNETKSVSDSGSLTQSFSQMNIDDANELRPQLSSRKSTLIFNDDDYDEHPKHHEHIGDQISSDEDRIMDDEDDIREEDEDENEDQNLISGAIDNSSVSSSVVSSSHSSVEPVHVAQDKSAESSHFFNSVGGSAQLHPSSAPNEQSDRMYVNQQQQNHQQQSSQELKPTMVPIEITWQQGGSKVYVTGSFTGWRKMIGLVPISNKPGCFHIKLQLPPGTHRFRFIVDNELRFSDYLPTATDQMGNFVNYLEIVPPTTTGSSTYDMAVQQQQQLQNQQFHEQGHDNHAADSRPPVQRKPSQSKNGKLSARSQLALHIEEDPDDMGNGYSRFREEEQLKPDYEYTRDIPAVFTDPTVMEQYYLTLDQQQNNQQNMSWLTPPQLPPQLENVILNNYNKSTDAASENNSGALPIPNHVVLNHLATSSIKHNTLCVASIVRYKRKYATQILYAPLQ